MPEHDHDTRAGQRRTSAANGSGEGVARAHPLISVDPEDEAIALPPAREAIIENKPLTPAPVIPSEPTNIERWERSRDLVSIGECLVEMSRRPDGAYQPSIAGDAFNTIFYASRLGVRCGLITAVGDDLFTPMIIERIVDEGIDLSQVQRRDGRRNGIYFIEHDAWGERHFHYWRDGSAATETLIDADLDALAQYIASSHYVLVTGVTLAVMKDLNAMRELLSGARGRTTVVLDANYRSRLWPSEHEYQFAIEMILPHVDVFLPSRQDLESAYDDRAPIDVMRLAADAGASTIVMKDGERGCAVFADDALVPIEPVERPHVVDTTGAGDAFNAGFIAALVRGSTIDEACDLAQRVAARSLIVPGAIDHAFTPHAIDAAWRVG